MAHDCGAAFSADDAHGQARDANELASDSRLFSECYAPANKPLSFKALIPGLPGYRMELPAQDWQTQAFMANQPAVGMTASFDDSGVRRGSGIFVRNDGVFATVDHNVQPHRENLFVQTSDGVEHPATILAEDPKNDVAILKVAPVRSDERFPVVNLGASASLVNGDPVLATGLILPIRRHEKTALGIAPGTYAGSIKDKNAPIDERLDYVDPERELAKITSITREGYSGGPVIAKTGAIVGLNDYGNMLGETDVVPIEHVIALMKANNI